MSWKFKKLKFELDGKRVMDQEEIIYQEIASATRFRN
jgi:hypothetical protein